MFSIRHWTWWNWLLAAILMPLLAGSIGLTIFIGLAVIALIAWLCFWSGSAVGSGAGCTALSAWWPRCALR